MLDYCSSVDRMAEAFGVDHVFIRHYHGDSLLEGNIINDFFHVCGLEMDEDLIEGAAGYSDNISISLESAYAMRLLNGIPLINRRRPQRAHMWSIVKLFSNNLIKSGNKQIQSREEREALLERCAESNRRLAERYMEGQALFDDKVEDEPVVKPDLRRELTNIHRIRKDGRRLEEEVENGTFQGW